MTRPDALTKIESVGEGVPARLQIFEDARREIAEANTVEDVNRILVQATGLAAAARKATDREMEAEAEVLRFEAERRLGQLMQAQKEVVGLSRGGRPSKTGVSKTPVSQKAGTLAEAGIDKNLAKKARTAAAMPEAEFKEAAEAKREAVRTRSKKTRSKKPKTKGPVATKDTALIAFTERVLDLVQKISKHRPERFADTAAKADDLARLGKFFTELAHLKGAGSP